MKTNYKKLLPGIKAFVFDVDGVFTDGTVQITTAGDQLRTMIVRDGYAVKQAVEHGYEICVITGGNHVGVRHRLRGLGVTDVHLGVKDKLPVIQKFFRKHDLLKEEVAYMGDDLPDLEAMQMAGLVSCPQDAVPEIKEASDYISHRNGGHGCVRDLIEQVMRVQGKWPGLKS